jgi:hypothetical protein
MLSPPTDRLHKFLAIAGVALFVLGVTIPLDRYDQSVRQFIEAKSKVMELSRAQLRLSEWLDSLGSVQQGDRTVRRPDPNNPAAGVDRSRLDTDPATLEREIAELSVQAQKQLDLAEHAERIRAVWVVLGSFCIFGGIALAAFGFALWWRQPADQR